LGVHALGSQEREETGGEGSNRQGVKVWKGWGKGVRDRYFLGGSGGRGECVREDGMRFTTV